MSRFMPPSYGKAANGRERGMRQNGSSRRRNGQAMIEFVVVMGILAAAVAILYLFIETHEAYGARVLRLVASEYP